MTSNKDLAKIFTEFGQILELKGGDRFKIAAYERAAEVIGSNGESLKAVYDRGGTKELEGLEGIGEGIAQKIEEYIKTGKIKELERLRRGVPAVELEILGLPGVGPKTAQKLFSAFKPKSLSDLKSKLRSKGGGVFKEKTLKNILRSTEIYQKRDGRMLLVEAKPIADKIVKFLGESSIAQDVIAVGSLRRFKDTIGDIDLVATSSEPPKAIEKFTQFEEFSKIINKGNTKSRAIHESGTQVDLEILPQDEYGSLLQHFTGSKEHNIALRTFAQAHGKSISEHGIKFVKTNQVKKCKIETEVYSLLGMDYIEPELREDRGEIEAALRYKLPNLIELKDIKGDLHIHSNYSDGSSSIEQIVEKAGELDYKYVAISDHTVGLGIARGLSPQRFVQRQREIEKMRKRFPKIKILSSCEVNIRPDGSLDMPDSSMETFDIVNASVHTSFNQSKEVMTKRILTAIENKFVDIIGHPTGRILNRREEYEADWPKIFAACVKNNVALEINAYPNRLDLTDGLVLEARKVGVKFAVSTDAHSVDQMEFMLYGVSVARRGWCEKKDILNSQEWKDKRVAG